jgi:hypothetical protein
VLQQVASAPESNFNCCDFPIGFFPPLASLYGSPADLNSARDVFIVSVQKVLTNRSSDERTLFDSII